MLQPAKSSAATDAVVSLKEWLRSDAHAALLHCCAVGAYELEAAHLQPSAAHASGVAVGSALQHISPRECPWVLKGAKEAVGPAVCSYFELSVPWVLARLAFLLAWVLVWKLQEECLF
jgi:hypothetical protein